MRIDSHHHFWHYDPQELVWMTDGMDIIRKDFLPEDLKPLLESIDFDGAISVEARQMLEETEWLLELSDQNDIVKGVVGWVDLKAPDVKDTLAKYSDHPKFCGVRHVLIDEPDEEYMLHPDFRRGVGALSEFNLTYDLLVHHFHLHFALALVTEFPEQPFVIDHIANPDIKNGMMSPWKEDLAKLANYKNVYCKLSGMVECAELYKWTAKQFTPYLDIVVDLFGTGRVMIGSNWPVCLLSGEFKPVMNIVIEYVRQFPEPVREQILGENCAEFYSVQK